MAELAIDGTLVPEPVQIAVSAPVIRLGHAGFWRAVMVGTSPTTSRCIGYVYAGDR